MARALGTRDDYAEGDAFDREKQEERRHQRLIESEEREQRREEEHARYQAQRDKRETEKEEKDRLRRMEEDRLRKVREEELAARERNRDVRQGTISELSRQRQGHDAAPTRTARPSRAIPNTTLQPQPQPQPSSSTLVTTRPFRRPRSPPQVDTTCDNVHDCPPPDVSSTDMTLTLVRRRVLALTL